MLLSFGRENQMKARTREHDALVPLRPRRSGVVRRLHTVLLSVPLAAIAKILGVEFLMPLIREFAEEDPPPPQQGET